LTPCFEEDVMRDSPWQGFKASLLLLLAAVCLGAQSAADGQDTDSSPAFTGELIFPIYVSDVEVSAVFYRDVLGFEFLGYYDYETNAYVRDWQDTEPPKYAGFVAGDQKFGLHKPANERQDECVGCGRYYFRVRDLDAQHARVSAHGVRVSPIHSSALLRRFHVPDPDGVMIFFAETASEAPLDPW
jgi:predicted enzyme related to lactoylglutathione lyase